MLAPIQNELLESNFFFRKADWHREIAIADICILAMRRNFDPAGPSEICAWRATLGSMTPTLRSPAAQDLGPMPRRVEKSMSMWSTDKVPWKTPKQLTFARRRSTLQTDPRKLVAPHSTTEAPTSLRASRSSHSTSWHGCSGRSPAHSSTA